MGGILAVGYGWLAYGIFWLAFWYAVGFVGNLFVTHSIDSDMQGPVGQALLVDFILLGLFAIQHSLTTWRRYQAWRARVVAEPFERSTTVLLSSLFLLLVFWCWQPVTAVIWEVGHPAAQLFLEGFFWLGWLIVIHSSFLIDHGDLFGLRQARLYKRRQAYAPVKFQMPDLYRYVRHPIMMGILIALWSTPVMTLGHFVFAAASAAYILFHIRQEEQELGELYGAAYREYRRRIPMLIPLPRRKD